MNAGKFDQAKRQAIVLRVAGQTNPVALRTAIVGYVKSGNAVFLDAVGVAANYQATKSVILARAVLSTMGMQLHAQPVFLEVRISNPRDGEVKTGIRWVLAAE